jgi:ubiquinol-cytochrome c reductase cytochrome b subunit
VTCLALGYLGSQAPEGWYLFFGRVFTAYYFGFFLLIMPIVGLIERPKKLPGSITQAVLGPDAARSPERPRAAVPEEVV